VFWAWGLIQHLKVRKLMQQEQETKWVPAVKAYQANKGAEAKQ
jgi:hypothetical protein